MITPINSQEESCGVNPLCLFSDCLITMKQKAKRFWKFAQILAILVVLSSSVTQAQPASVWTTSTSGAWNDSANWNSGIVPNGNAVNITATGASYTANYSLDDGSGTFTNLTLGTGTLGQSLI
jgi:hypothetical protein